MSNIFNAASNPLVSSIADVLSEATQSATAQMRYIDRKKTEKLLKTSFPALDYKFDMTYVTVLGDKELVKKFLTHDRSVADAALLWPKLFPGVTQHRAV
jgi:hypothetical protein